MNTKRFVEIIKADRRDTKEAVKALRLQAIAWRYVAIIGTADQKRAVELSRWLFSVTVPFTDGDAVEKFLEENNEFVEKCGYKSGVFDKREAA